MFNFLNYKPVKRTVSTNTINTNTINTDTINTNTVIADVAATELNEPKQPEEQELKSEPQTQPQDPQEEQDLKSEPLSADEEEYESVVLVHNSGWKGSFWEKNNYIFESIDDGDVGSLVGYYEDGNPVFFEDTKYAKFNLE